jgi:hypothetical protein
MGDSRGGPHSSSLATGLATLCHGDADVDAGLSTLMARTAAAARAVAAPISATWPNRAEAAGVARIVGLDVLIAASLNVIRRCARAA